MERERAISEEPVTLSSRDGRRANQQQQQQQQQRARAIPLSLGAGDDGTEGGGDHADLVYPSESDPNATVNYKRWGRAAFQWGVIIAIVVNVRRARNQGSAVTKRLGLAGEAERLAVPPARAMSPLALEPSSTQR
jgi:hypothetical protein